MILEISKFIFYATLIVLVSKYVLVISLRKLAENLNLKPNIVGNIAGIATSIPELLTVSISSLKGLLGTSIYNILSSNVINLLQYIFSIIMNKNYKEIKNRGIQIQIILVVLTIIIPLILLFLRVNLDIVFVPVFLFLYIIFTKISNNTHKKYLETENRKIFELELKEEKYEKKQNKKTFIYVSFLVISGILLYFIGSKLGESLENLASIFNISQWILGILLGVITSIPELITFFEAQKHYNDVMLGVVEATNNLLTSNILNLFLIQVVGIVLYYL